MVHSRCAGRGADELSACIAQIDRCWKQGRLLKWPALRAQHADFRPGGKTVCWAWPARDGRRFSGELVARNAFSLAQHLRGHVIAAGDDLDLAALAHGIVIVDDLRVSRQQRADRRLLLQCIGDRTDLGGGAARLIDVLALRMGFQVGLIGVERVSRFCLRPILVIAGRRRPALSPEVMAALKAVCMVRALIRCSASARCLLSGFCAMNPRSKPMSLVSFS